MASLTKRAEGEVETDESTYWAGDDGKASGILPISRTSGNICLAWRNEHTHGGECWGTIGGAAKKGMNVLESAISELVEETGYTGSLTLYPSYMFQDGDFSYYNFIGVCDRDFELKAKKHAEWETDEIVWVSYKELYSMVEDDPQELHPELIEFLKHAKNKIRRLTRKMKIAGSDKTPPARIDTTYPEYSNGWALFPDRRGDNTPVDVTKMAPGA